MDDKRIAELARLLAAEVIREASKWRGDTFETGQMLYHSLMNFAGKLDPAPTTRPSPPVVG